MLSHPEQVVDGIGQLERVAYAVALARYGHAPSILHLAGLVERIGGQIVLGLRGAELLGAGEGIRRRLRWAVVWEVASMVAGEVAEASDDPLTGEASGEG
jgi:hypothetical protein